MGINRLRTLHATARSSEKTTAYFKGVCDNALEPHAKVGKGMALGLAERIFVELLVDERLGSKQTDRLHEWALLLRIAQAEISRREEGGR